MECLAIDFLGPLLQSKRGNKYILIAANYFMKWVNEEAVTVAEVLIREFISRFKIPLILHSDQGWNFESAVSSEMCKLRVAKPGPFPSTHSLTVWWNTLTVPLRLNSQNLLRITNKTGISRNLSQGCYSCCDIHWNSYSNSMSIS